MSKSPLIGISASIEISSIMPQPGQEKAYVNREYIHAVSKAGGIPLMLPIVDDEALIQAQVAAVDGVIITGGYDVHPSWYGEEPDPLLEDVFPERDVYEMKMIKVAYELEKPIFGICRGMQLINVAFGGSLYQDLSHIEGRRIQHRQKAPVYVPTHTVETVATSRLRFIFERKMLETNSFHHQSIKELAPGFISNATAGDGVIEGIEKPNDPFLIGVQWHPEWMIKKHPVMLRIFEHFISAARNVKNETNEE